MGFNFADPKHKKFVDILKMPLGEWHLASGA